MRIFFTGISKFFQCIDHLVFIRFIYRDDSLDHQIQLEERIRRLGIVFIKIAQWYASFSQETNTHWFHICMKFQTQSYPSQPFPVSYRTHDFFLDHPISNWENVECIASGSIGSVYKLDNYAIKIQHPWVSQEFEIFVGIFQWIKWILAYFFKKSIHIDELYEMLEGQFDFRREAQNISLYQELYSNESQYITIPKVYHAEKTILIMEYINSRYVTKSYLDRIERFVLLKCWVLDQIILKQVLHGDLHQGNWIFTEKGIAIFDFGYIFHIQTFSNELYSQMLSNDPVSISKALISLFEIDTCHQTQIIQWIQEFKETQENTCHNYSLILAILKRFVFQKMVIMNKRLFFLFNLMMIMRTIHESIPVLKNHSQSSRYCNVLLQRLDILTDFRRQFLLS